MDKLFDLGGKTALITGGSRGLGREMALAFADHGADVIVTSRKLDNCESVAAEDSLISIESSSSKLTKSCSALGESIPRSATRFISGLISAASTPLKRANTPSATCF